MKNFFALLLLCLNLAGASETPKITVAAAGTAKVTPTGLQVWVTLKEKGADATVTAEALKASQEKMAAKLAPFGVKSEQLKSDLPTTIDRAAQEVQRQRRSGGRLKRKTPAEEKTEIEMQQVVRAVIPLTAKDLPSLVVEAENLKLKLKAAKLVDDKPTDVLGEVDEEEMNYPYDQQQARAPVSFVFFASRSEGAQNEALTDALKKANESAARAAKAMGKAGAELQSLTVQSDGSEQDMYQGVYGYDRYGRPNPAPTQEEGMVSQTPQMTLYARISAEFSLK